MRTWPGWACPSPWCSTSGSTSSADARAIAARFARVFEAHLLPADWRELDDEGLTELAGSLARLQRHAGQVLQSALDAAMVRIAEERLGALVRPGPS